MKNYIEQIKTFFSSYYLLISGFIVSLAIFIYSCYMLFTPKNTVIQDLIKIEEDETKKELEILNETTEELKDNENDYKKALLIIEEEKQEEIKKTREIVKNIEEEILTLDLDSQALALKKALD